MEREFATWTVVSGDLFTLRYLLQIKTSDRLMIVHSNRSSHCDEYFRMKAHIFNSGNRLSQGGFKSEVQQGVNEWKLRLSKPLRAYARRPRMANEMHV